MTRAEKAAQRILDLQSHVKDLYAPMFSSISWFSPVFFLHALSLCHFAKFILRSFPQGYPHISHFISPIFPYVLPCDANSQKNRDADLEASQSELTFLRLQLRALEVQCSAYIPFGADEDLSESIKNWKLEWADIDQRTKARRKKRKDVMGTVDELGTAVHGSR